MTIRFSTIEKCRICDLRIFDTLFKFQDREVLAEPVKPGSHVPCGPLTVNICRECGYVFLREVIDSAVYSDYIYTPQTSSDVVAYLKEFVSDVIFRTNLRPGCLGLEIGSGDGTLCQEFKSAGVTFIGVEPSKILCEISRQQKQVETYNDFMSLGLVAKLGPEFDLVVVRHVLEHIDDFTSFFNAIDKCLKPDGTLIIEVPCLDNIIKKKQFYAFFFEHLSYFNISSLANLLKRFNYFINWTKFVYPEGGSILIYATRKVAPLPMTHMDLGDTGFAALKESLDIFQTKFKTLIREFGPIAAYGAGQRGITLLNLMGATKTNVIAVFDENPIYHGLITPRSEIPVLSPVEMNVKSIPGKVLILASSYDEQIRRKYNHMKGHFVSLSELMEKI